MDVDDTALRRLNLNLIYSLDAILHARSLTDAGRQIHLGQPAMSGALRRLREQFDDPLVTFTGGEPRLSALALVLRPKVRQLMQGIDETFRLSLHFDPRTARRTFRIATGEALEIMLMGRVVGTMLGKAPFVDIEIVPLDHGAPASAFSQGVDLIILPQRLAVPGLPERPLMAEHLSCMVCDRHPSVGQALSIDEYLALPHAVVGDASWPAAHFSRSVRELLARRRISLRTSRYAALPQLLTGTELVATGSTWLFQHQASMGALRVFKAPFHVERDVIVAQRPAGAGDDPAIEWLLGQLEQATATFPGGRDWHRPR
ncbi:DNA-binding transcriptional LysR family regulator [Sphingomonas jinjuensis]|uniref:DNA-binding transcriptional LysR family regulator n=1 Tax=Sphingomonas jinjuensis TaxID=535907 RepID=A0A840F2I0_9SPHN|nr:LysR family transcriptional regulator [Sphingomonas jinjuensis]MBB4153553.1 DNA-binding transcriptional LysR family regulator [Sphingomonas jinjuensis]